MHASAAACPSAQLPPSSLDSCAPRHPLRRRCRIDHLPLFNRLFELMGLGVSGWFAYRWAALHGWGRREEGRGWRCLGHRPPARSGALLFTSEHPPAPTLPACPRWLFVAGEKEVITKQVSAIASKVGLDL